MNVNPGELNKRIEILLISEEQDEDGFPVSEPVVIKRPWAKVSQYSAKEKLLAGTDMSDVKMRFLIRYSKTKLHDDMIVRYAGKLYEIKMINNYDESNEYIEIIGERVSERQWQA